jgi:hypothetical protein
MRTLISVAIVGGLAACAAAPHPVPTVPAAPLSAVYDVDAQTMVAVVYDATRAAHYRVAVVDPEHGRARFVMMPREGGSPLVVHLVAYSTRRDRLETCLGSCSTAIEVSSLVGDDVHAHELLDAIGMRARDARLDP